MKVVLLKPTDYPAKLRYYVSSGTYIAVSMACLCNYIDERVGTNAGKLKALAKLACMCLEETEIPSSSKYPGFPSVVSTWLWSNREVLAKAANSYRLKKPMPVLSFPEWTWADFECAKSLPLEPRHRDMLVMGVARRPQIKKYLDEMARYFETVAPGDRTRAIEDCLVSDQATLRELFERHLREEELDVEGEEVSLATPEEIAEAKEYFFSVLPSVEKAERNLIYKQLGLVRPPQNKDEWATLLRNFTRVFTETTAEGRCYLREDTPLADRIERMCVLCA